MKKRSTWQRVGDFIVGKGFYIVLFLCVATIGISGYYLVSVFSSGGEAPEQPVTGNAQVVLPDEEEPAAQPSVLDGAVQPLPQTEGGSDEEPEPEPPAQSTAQPAAAEDPGEQVTAAPVYTWPVRGEVISNFSLEVLAYDETMGDWRTHSGLDIAAAAGTRVLAVSDGTVSRVYEDDLMGTTVVIDHGDGLVSAYYNLGSKPTVAQGDRVSTGDVIGTVGQTALAEISRPAHLHLEMSLDGRAVDPVNYLPQT